MKVKPKEEAMKKRMGKPLRILLKYLGAIAIVIVLFLAVVFIADKVASKSDQGKIEPYGQFVTIDGKKMNVLIQGKGQETVVLLPGYGTAAPALDFKLLIDELTPYYKVVAIDPFGYGLSDETEKERTTENIVSEIHEALQQLHITRYTLMGHSIAGIYGLDYVNKYPNEVSAFVGIDSSVPTQPGMDVKFPLTMLKFLKQSGLQRFLVSVGSDPYASLLFDDKTKEQMKMIMNKNANNNTMLNEMKNIYSNFKGAQNLTFPKNLPLLLFVETNNTSVEGWIPLHEGQIKDSVHGKVVTMDGTHYLHHTKFKEIVESLREFQAEIK
ncbi:alpha/beta hydrolase [Paenibacillus chitinolyticus]|uniref:Alpha/beta hydrolase n=2 Tax=Paenibacillus chitinolyticus TaxID=79263 RepID=A0A410X550_9BACL|nr:alpha/beta hydrolase [Paenibacillus chitinolyticus]MCY9590562.1 alpha/beta hydrolase [Paenibacillus chitinolyticus]QAV21739.1 alpha/beta hydrolase [Paenibacillus chitinolyticus]